MKELMRWAAWLGGFFLTLMLGTVIYMGMNRVVVIADTSSVLDMTHVSDSEELPGREISLQAGEEAETFIRIPVESSIGAENIVIENQYVNRRLVLHIRGAMGSFYEERLITGYVEPVQKATYTVTEEGVTLYLQLGELYEYESILERGYLQVNLYKPSERYARVVILDAEVSEQLNSKEKEALYKIEEKLQAALEAEDIRVYSASDRRGDADEEKTLQLIEQTRAGMYVGLMFDKDADASVFGSYVCYNSLYFRPWLTNGSFADRIEREMVGAIEGKALGLVEVKEGVLAELQVPAAVVCPGYLSHETEGQLLLKDSYQDKIAAGICAGIVGTLEELKE